VKAVSVSLLGFDYRWVQPIFADADFYCIRSFFFPRSVIDPFSASS